MSGLMTSLIVAVHVIACIALMISILLQSGKGGGLAGAFGGGSSQTLFGGRGAAGFLGRATTVLAVIFFVTSLTLGIASSRQGGSRSLVQEEARRRAGQRTATGTTPTGPQTPQLPQPPPAGQATGTQQPGTVNPTPAPGTDPATTTPPTGAGQSPEAGGTR
jgi:preprotein translocase subunit SecG